MTEIPDERFDLEQGNQIVEAREQASGRWQLISILLVVIGGVVVEVLGFRFFNGLVERVGSGVVVLLLVSVVLAAIVRGHKGKAGSINEQLLAQAARDGLIETEESSPEERDNFDFATRISELLLWAIIVFDALGLLLLLSGGIVAGVIMFVVSSALLFLWIRLRAVRMREAL